MPMVGLIMSFIAVMIALLIGIMIFSEVSDIVICPVDDGTGNSFAKECQKAKDNSWILMGIMPIALIIMILPLVRIIGMPNIFHKKSKFSSKQTRNLSFFAKVLLYFGLAKLKDS